ncbi:hypothetical protein LEP1GSC019_0314 [Leptospira interrogans serovar Pyrogenes str. 2006006960]|nr:hypothetical protein LEP1GSC019_0314 [Leptospira interrogans serovar Pyrogenes str. 2006006960]
MERNLDMILVIKNLFLLENFSLLSKSSEKVVIKVVES